jgi:TetR/AcrR family transcriptional repressor of lmrAB and yxaGH operons
VLPHHHDSLDAFIAACKTVVADSDFAAGCPIAGAGLSRSLHSAIPGRAGDASSRWQTTLRASRQRHGFHESTAPTLANTTLAAGERAVILTVAQKSVTALDDVGAQLAVLVDHHLRAVAR